MKITLDILGKLFNNKLFLKLFSVGAAVLFWLIIVINISPEYTKTVTGIAVTVNEKSGLLSNAGLHVVDQSLPKISIEVSGPRYIIGNLKATDFAVTPDVGLVNKAGPYNLKLDAVMVNPDPKVNITKILPASIEVNFDTIVSKTLTVVPYIIQSKIPDGYIQQAPTVSPQMVVVTGPAADVAKIAKAVTNISVDSSYKDTVIIRGDVVLLDSKNVKLNLPQIKIDNSSVNVTVPILKTTTAKFAADFINIPAGFDKNNIKLVINPANVNIFGSAKDIDAVNQTIKLESIDFNTLDLTNNLTVALIPIKGITNVENITSTAVAVNLLNTAEKSMIAKTFAIINAPAGYSTKVRTTQISGVRLFGPAVDIASVNAVTAQVDMATIPSVVGQFEVPVTITVPGKTGYWVKGSYKVIIQLTKN